MQQDQKKVRFSIVLPARNEQERIGRTIETYHQRFQDRLKSPFELIVVANACTDRTTDVVRQLQDGLPGLRLVELQQPGKGRAIIEGFRQSSGQVLAFCDSDGSTEGSDVVRLLEEVDKGVCECAIASRWLPESKVPVPQPLKRRIASRIFNLAVRILLGLRFRDTQCGAKAFSREAWSGIENNIHAFGYHFDCEVLYRLKAAGRRICEIPVTWRDIGGSGIQVGSDGLKMLRGLLAIRFEKPEKKGRSE